MSCPSFHKIRDPKARVKTIHVYGSYNHSSDIKWAQPIEKSDPLYRVVDRFGDDLIHGSKLALPFPGVFGAYFQDFFRVFSLWRFKFNWVHRLSINKTFVNRLLEKRLSSSREGSLLFRHKDSLRADICKTQCEFCSPVSSCPLCEHTIGHFTFALKAENKRIQQYTLVKQLRCISSHRAFPEFATHKIVTYIIGNSPDVILVKDLAVTAILHVNNFYFAEQIRSRVDRHLFCIWASAFIEGRLGQFHQEVYNSESLDSPSLDISKVDFNLDVLGNFADYDSYLLLPAGQLRDIPYRDRENLNNHYPNYPLLESGDIEAALLA